MINGIQNKSFCFQNICVCTVYIYYVQVHTKNIMKYHIQNIMKNVNILYHISESETHILYKFIAQSEILMIMAYR